MKATKLIAAALFAAMTLTIPGHAAAAGGHPARGGHSAGSGHRAGSPSRHNRPFSRTFQNSFYPYYGNGYGYGYGNDYVQNSDEADWGEQWTSVTEDDDGPYAKSTRENPPGGARMWEFNESSGHEQPGPGQ
jgi:hypothetical protein